MDADSEIVFLTRQYSLVMSGEEADGSEHQSI